MADRVVLHIGAPKTGTTFLQAVLFHNQAALADSGVLVPGESRTDHGRAATGVRQGPDGNRRSAWDRMVHETRKWPGTVVLSNEWFSMAAAEDAHVALRDLSTAETHVVVTARDFVEHVPAAWQETLKLGRDSSLDDFLASLDRKKGRWRWSVLDPAAALERWRGDLPVENLHVVTVPPKGSDPALLWKRFAHVCGIEPDRCETDLNQARESLGTESARLLQRLGPLLREAIDADTAHWSETYRWIQAYLSHDLLVPHGGSRITLRPGQIRAVRERSIMSVQALASSGYDIVGDLGDLTSVEPQPDGRYPDDVTDSELLEVALPLIADLLRDRRAESNRRSSETRLDGDPASGQRQ